MAVLSSMKAQSACMMRSGAARAAARCPPAARGQGRGGRCARTPPPHPRPPPPRPRRAHRVRAASARHTCSVPLSTRSSPASPTG
ncbi:unnamed protein product [Arctia plantaginis]|uniref:Uncharacterized protein n=1 Tax=Arctia plantaginis TaxID=874455 RepID=A0A8S1ATE1_ARCPL|nr:unnamed protein product [Arctia plantaginis]